MNVDVEFSDARRLEADLGKIPGRVVRDVEAVTKRAAQNIKTMMAADAENDGHYPDFADAVTYERKFSSLTSIDYEIGPDKDRRQGALGNILYFGTSNNAPVLQLETPIMVEVPNFLRALRDAAAGTLESR